MAPLKQWKTKLTSLLGRTAAKIDVLPVREALPLALGFRAGSIGQASVAMP